MMHTAGAHRFQKSGLGCLMAQQRIDFPRMRASISSVRFGKRLRILNCPQSSPHFPGQVRELFGQSK